MVPTVTTLYLTTKPEPGPHLKGKPDALPDGTGDRHRECPARGPREAPALPGIFLLP